MSDEVIKVTGLKEVRDALYSYSRQLGDRVILSALREGANVTRKAAQAAAPVRKGVLRRGVIVSRSKKYRARPGADKIGVYLTLRQGKRAGKNDAFYGRFIEDGWNVRGKRKAGGMSGGRGRKTMPGKRDIPGRKFIKGSFERTKYQAVQTIIQAAERGAEIVKSKLGLR